MPPEPQSPWTIRPARRTTRKEWIDRFGVYFLGVAIGLVLLGLLYQMKQASIRAQQGQQLPAAVGPPTGP
jgi:hypothetical protein